MRFRAFWLVSALFILACAGSRPDDGSRLDPDKEKLIDALTLFVEAVQGDRFEKALGYLTLEEKSRMTEGTGQVSPPVQKQLKALRLSTLAGKSGVHLEKGKLAGIHTWLPNIDHTVPGEAPTQGDSIAPVIQ